jgi:hypothetical protein
MCHGIIVSGLIEIESQHDWNYGTPQIANKVLIGKWHLYYDIYYLSLPSFQIK